MLDENKNLEKGYEGYAIAAAAFAMGYQGKLYREQSSLPPFLELTITPELITWPKKKYS